MKIIIKINSHESTDAKRVNSYFINWFEKQFSDWIKDNLQDTNFDIKVIPEESTEEDKKINDNVGVEE